MYKIMMKRFKMQAKMMTFKYVLTIFYVLLKYFKLKKTG